MPEIISAAINEQTRNSCKDNLIQHELTAFSKIMSIYGTEEKGNPNCPC